MNERIPSSALRGRGAVSNHSGRFEATTREAFDDGWFQEPQHTRPTTVMTDTARHVITYNTSPDLGFDRTINPYRGCEHGCIYCYARPTHAYWGLSPGQDFETKLFAKYDAADVLRRELANPKYKPALILLGANTDAYQPIDREHRITRSILEVLREFRHPVSTVTKSALVMRDMDLWVDLAEQSLGHVTLSITTLDRQLARAMEPRAATPGRRLDAVRALSAAGVPVCVNVAPVIPGLTDHEIEPILEAAAEAGASEAAYTLVRLPLEIKDLFCDWLETHYPDRRSKVENLIRQTRGGALYQSGFGERMRGTGTYAELIRQRFAIAVKRLGLSRRFQDLRIDLFQVPPASGQQLDLSL